MTFKGEQFRRRLFSAPILELIRLLRDAAEVEHSLMLQYLYAAFSVKTPRYATLAGITSHQYGGKPLHLLGIAIEEMVHLTQVNKLLVALGASPTLNRQQFPLEVDIYPFPLSLEPLSLKSVAKYLYVEAPAGAIDPTQAPESEIAFLNKLYSVLGGQVLPNRVGSLYERIIGLLQEVKETVPNLTIDYDYWTLVLREIQQEGEEEHFELFKSIFLGMHPAMQDVKDVWSLPLSHPDYPAYHLPVNPSAVIDGVDDLVSEQVQRLGQLSNLIYWMICMCLDLSYRNHSLLFNSVRRLMSGPLRSLGQHLAQLGHGIPFDGLAMGYSVGITERHNHQFIKFLADEASRLEQDTAVFLPEDYPRGLFPEFINDLESAFIMKVG
jgi:hypothetical protein